MLYYSISCIVIAGSLIQAIEHPCKFEDNGCQEKMMLADISEHEENCLFRKIKCPWCKEEVMASNLGSHGDCFEDKTDRIRKGGRSKIVNTLLLADWDQKSWITRAKKITWDDQEFYTMGYRVREEGRLLFFVAMLGSVKERSKYKAKFSVMNPKSFEMEVLTTSEVLPVETLEDKKAVLNSRASGSVNDKVLERYVSILNGYTHFRYNVEINKW